jgi:hypothetical protein
MGAAEVAEIMEANLGGTQISVGDFDRVKVPSGGGTIWEVPTLEGPRPERFITGVIVYWRDNRAMWKKAVEEGGSGQAPDCTGRLIPLEVGSASKVWTGKGVRWEGDDSGPHDCSACPYNDFGSADKGEGKKCKETRMLAILTPEGFMPLLLNIPPTSLKLIRQFCLRLAGRGIPLHGVQVKIGLNKTKNKGGTDYCEVVPELVETLDAANRALMKAYVDQIKPVLETVEAEESAAAAGGTGSSFAEGEGGDLEDLDTDAE